MHPDDPIEEPHAPISLTYPQYALTMVARLNRCLSRNCFATWGNERKYQKIWQLNPYCGLFGLIARILFWYLFLGTAGFLFFFIPSYLFNNILFTHLNYYSHRPHSKENGNFEILNLNHNLYYKFMNSIFYGIYFHKNHHLKPSLSNPCY